MVQGVPFVEEDLGPNIFHKDGKGNRYYFANGEGAWTAFDIKDTNRDNWADVGSDLPFADGLSFVRGELDTFSTIGENPTWIERVNGWAEGVSDNVFDNDPQTTLDFEADDSEFASLHYIYELEGAVSNVKWFVNHSSGSEELNIPEACLIDWDGYTRIGLMIDIDLGTGDVQFRCAEEISEGMLAYEGFGKVVSLTEPFKISESWITYSESGESILWMGEGEDAHPWTETSIGGGSTNSGGSTGSGGRTGMARLNADRDALVAQIRSLVGALLQKGMSVPAQLQAWFAAEQSTAPNTNFVAPTFCNDGVRDLQNGSEGEEVKGLQNLLIARGYSIPPGATGLFMNYTRSALTAYQRDNGIAPSAGYFGCITRAQMKSAGHSGLWW